MTQLRQRQPRLFDPGFLRFLRTKPCCCGCNRASPSEAAHIRIGLFAKGMKPHDKHAVPLNRWCHRDGPDNQHENENLFWERRNLDPFELAAKLYDEYGGAGGVARKPRTTIKPRLPKEQRTKIQGRGFGPQKRKFIQ